MWKMFAVPYSFVLAGIILRTFVSWIWLQDWNYSRIPSGHGLALSYISLIGIGLSIAGLILTLVTFIIFR